MTLSEKVLTPKLHFFVITTKFINQKYMNIFTENKVFCLIKYKKMKMNAKNILVSFVAIVMALFLVATVSAYTISGDLARDISVKVDGMYVGTDVISVIAGETATIKIYFTAEENDTNVRVEAEIEGEKINVNSVTNSFDVEADKKYRKVLTLKVPYELKDKLSDDLTLNIEIDGKKYKTEVEDIILRVQRVSYNADFKSISVAQTLEAGETFPVDIVVKNIGYNDLDDVYVIASIPALGIKKASYFGDLVSDEWNYDDDDETDTFSGRIYLKIPYNVKPGIYALEVEIVNDDVTINKARQIIIENEFPENVIVSSSVKTVDVGEDAEYSLLIVNPTNKLKVYRIITESTEEVSSSAKQTVVAVQAGSSKSVLITANANSAGEYDFDVNVFSGEELVGTVNLGLNAKAREVTDPVVILTVILAIIFLVLLVVLIVLVTKKPEKEEEFGESYY